MYSRKIKGNNENHQKAQDIEITTASIWMYIF